MIAPVCACCVGAEYDCVSTAPRATPASALKVYPHPCLGGCCMVASRGARSCSCGADTAENSPALSCASSCGANDWSAGC